MSQYLMRQLMSINVAALMAGEAAADAYIENGEAPPLVLDFGGVKNSETPYFRLAGSDSSFASIATFARTGPATYVNSSGTIATAADGVERTSHHIWDGSAWVPRILYETETRTNLCQESEDFSTTWTSNNANLTASDATGPRGASTMTLLSDNSATGTGEVYVDYAFSGLATSSIYTFSIWLTADQLAFAAIETNGFTTPADGKTFFNLTTGAAGTTASGHFARIKEHGNTGVYRCSIRFTTDGTDTAGSIRVYVADADADTTVDLDGTSSIHIDGAQMERVDSGVTQGPMSSYIPTNGATSTRNGETMYIAAANVPYSTNDMSFHFQGEIDYEDNSGAEMYLFGTGSGTNYIFARILATASRTGELEVYHREGATGQDIVETADTY